MALLKAFVCQVVLLGLYKLFLEQVFEDYLVPDELTRNCLVGFVCLLCFGIQLYTDKAADEDNAEVDENPKSESSGAKNVKISMSAEISTTYEAVGSSTSNRVTAPKSQTISREIATKEKISNLRQDSKERNGAEPTIRSGIFTQFTPNMSDGFPNVVNPDCKGKQDVPISYSQETTTIPVFNGFSETNVCEESDEDGIEIDQLVAKESAEGIAPVITEKIKQLETVEVIESKDVTEQATQLGEVEDGKVEAIQRKDVTERATQLEVEDGKVEAIEPKDVTEQATQLEVETTKHEDVLKADVESKHLMANGEDFSSTQDSDKNGTLKTDLPSEAGVTNGIAEEALNDIENISNIIEEFEGEKSIEEESEIGNGQETSWISEPKEQTKKNSESLASTQEISDSSLNSSIVHVEESMNTNNTETTLVKTAVLPPSEKMTSTARQRIAAGDLCIAPVTIDISFIYACH